jgi:hypothetical protein
MMFLMTSIKRRGKNNNNKQPFPSAWTVGMKAFNSRSDRSRGQG